MSNSTNQDLVEYRIQRAKETIEEAELLNENNFWNASINRIYYASFYAVSALLLKNQIDAQTHSGVRQMFGLHFIKNGKIDKEHGKFYSEIFDKRQTGDYDDFIVFTEEEVADLLNNSKKLISEIEKFLRNVNS